MSELDNVIEFPETRLVQWKPYERMLRERWASEDGPDQDDVERMISCLREVYLDHARGADTHVSTLIDPDPFMRVQEWIARLTFGLLLEIAAREAKIIQL